LGYLGSEAEGILKIQGKITFLKKIGLLFRRRKDSASRTETLGDFSQAKSTINLRMASGIISHFKDIYKGFKIILIFC
jgi:hypothetical protein